MAYKINGNVGADCTMYVIGATHSGIETVKNVSAGNYEIG